MQIEDAAVLAHVEKARGKKYGKCVLCGNRVYSGHDHITTTDGYCHRLCLSRAI